jgi:hypothetical protein
MQKKNDLDIPTDDLDSWARYPRHRWVYEASRLLDAQNIKWSPVPSEQFGFAFDNLSIKTDQTTHCSGKIYLEHPSGRPLYSEVYISRGEIKFIRHVDPKTGENLTELTGGTDLRINAIVSLYFAKFSGVITCHLVGDFIYRIYLRPQPELGLKETVETLRISKKIFRKTDSYQILGLSDQALQQAHAS